MTDDPFAAPSVGTHPHDMFADEVPAVRDRRRDRQVVLVGTISGLDILESTVTIVEVQDGRRRHAELVVTLVAGATITVDGRRRALPTLVTGQKVIVTGTLDGVRVTSRELHALTFER